MKKSVRRITVILSVFLLISALSVLIGVILLSVFSKKHVDSIADERLFESMKGQNVTEYYVSDSEDAYDPILLQTVSFCENTKLWTSVEECSSYLKNGFIAVEDREFYGHKGVNLRRSLYALFNSVFHLKSTFGASTITQQVIKNISGDNEVTVRRKLAEMIRAFNIERNHAKDEILELYMNVIPMGENLIGVGAAAESFFGKSCSELSPSEAAVLIGIANAPTRYNPYDNYQNCLKKRNTVLDVMKSEGVITEEEYSSALSSPIILNTRKDSKDQVYSWFLETVNSDVIDALMKNLNISVTAASKLLYAGGLKIYTTENRAIQRILEEYFSDAAAFPEECGGGLDFAMAISDSQSGDLLGIVGGVGEKSGNKLLNMATAPHTPGSALKPIALYAPLINEKRITWATVIDDVPESFIGADNVAYPKNYPPVYDGLLPIKDALRLSKNTVAIKLYGMLGSEHIYSLLRHDFELEGIIRRKKLDDGSILTDLAPSPLALGQLSYGVSLRRLTEAYTVFPRGGEYSVGRSFVAVYDAAGDLILENRPEVKRIFDTDAAAVMNKLLSCVTENGTASAITLKRSVDVAGKTGTSGDDRDRLFIGYTPYVTAGIWCGYRTSDKSIGRIAPTHIKVWDEVMKRIHSELLRGLSDHEISSFSDKGLVRSEYCRDSGELYSPICAKDARGSRMDVGYFIKGTEPKELCHRHVLCLYDRFSEAVANQCCPSEFVEGIALIRVDSRHFPQEVTVTDAEYVYWDIDEKTPIPEDYTLPYFYYAIPEGEFVGRGRKKKQFNSGCYIHSE